MKTIEIIDGVTTGGVFSKDIDDNFVELNGKIGDISGGTALYGTTLDPALAVPTTIGGIAAGTTVSQLNTKTIVEVFDEMLFPTLLPTYTIPIITLASTITGIVEIGTSVRPTLTIQARKNDGGAFTALKAQVDGFDIVTANSIVESSATDIASQFGYTDPNNPNINYTLTITDISNMGYTNNTMPPTLIYQAFGNYSSGSPKRNSKNVLDSRTPAVRSTTAPQIASTNFATAPIVITGYYPYFYGKSAVELTPAEVVLQLQTGTGFTKVINSGAGSLSMDFNAYGEWCWFVIFDPYPTKTVWYENALNNGNIGGVSDLFALPQTITMDDPSMMGNWHSTDFKVYVANKVTTLGTAVIS